MKRKKLITMFILMATSLFAFSQSANNRTIATNDMHFRIPAGANLKEPIIIDISALHIANYQVGHKLALGICDNLLTFDCNETSTFSLQLNQNPVSKIQSVEDWNVYISSLFPRFEKMEKAINQ